MLPRPGRMAGCRAWVRLVAGVDRRQQLKRPSSALLELSKIHARLVGVVRWLNAAFRTKTVKTGRGRAKKWGMPENMPLCGWVRG